MSLSAIMELPGFIYPTREGSLSISYVYIPVHSELIHVFHMVFSLMKILGLLSYYVLVQPP